jgi:hypothetical protein
VNLSSIVFLGWFHILDKTIYSFDSSREGLGPKEHSFFVTFLFHGLNLYTLLSYALAKYLKVNPPLYVGLFVGLAVFAIGYFRFYRKKASELLRDAKNTTMFLLATLALAYVIGSVYLMFAVGDYVRAIVLSQKAVPEH